MLIRPFKFMLAPDDAGGGGAAVAEPAAASTDNDQLMTFAPPNIDEVMAGIKAPGETAPEVKAGTKAAPLAKKVEAATKVEQKPAAQAKPAGEPPAAQLRKELDAARAERDSLKAQLEKGDPRLAEAQAAVKAKEEELKGINGRLTEYERRLQMASPAVQEKLTALDKGYDADANKFYTRVPEIDQASFNSILQDYAKLPFGKEGYKEARAAFEAKVNERLGGDEEREHRKLGAVIDFLERTYDFVGERDKTFKEVQANARKIQVDADKEVFGKAKTRINSLIEKARTIPEGMETTDPFHPRVALDTFAKALGDGASKLDDGIPQFIEKVMAGIAPRTDEDYAGMTPEQIQESRQNEAQDLETSKDRAVEVMFNGLRALRLFPALVKDWQRLKARVKDDAEALPPDPTKPAGAAGGGEEDDLRSFKAPDLNKISF